MKTAKELFELLNSFDEDRRIEAKSASAVGKSMMETVCAFSNEPGLRGGYLLLGAKRVGMADDGKPIYEPENIENSDKIQSDFVAMCNSMFNIHIRPIIQVEEYQGKTVVVVKIEELPVSQKPAYFAKRGLPEGAFRRIGPSDEKCSEEDMYLFYQSADTYDSCVVDDTDLDDIDENALGFYRRLRKEVNPEAEELSLDDTNLLRALGAIKKTKEGGYQLTYTGLLVFGKQMSLRRLVPSFRVDYIRISGNQWMADGNNRFEQTIDMRGPLMLMVNKACSAVMDDLPKGFELKDSLQASTPAILPNKVLREAIVNAFIHRSNRVNQPIQIIRYSNRIEIHNPGYSLKSPELWGEPGSELRNPRISEIFHDTQHGTLCEKIPPQGEMFHGEEEKNGEMFHGKQEMFHGKDEKSGEMFHGKQEIYHGEEKIYHALSRDSLIAELPEELKKKILGMKKWTAKEEMNQLIISLCSLRPYSIDELELILQRDPKSLKGHKIKALLETKQLFYWIPEIIRHPQQKYIADPSMARSKTKNNNKNDHK